MTTGLDETVLVGNLPPDIRHDRMTQAWAFSAAVSWWGDVVFSIAVSWTAVHTLAAGWAGLVVAVALLPQGLLMLAGGVLADRVQTQRLMLAGELARVVTLLVAILLWSTGHRSGLVLAGIGLCFGTVAGLSNPARATLLRQLVRPEDLGVATGWTQLGSRLASLTGAPVGAFVVATTGLAGAMVLDAATFVVVALVLAVVVRPRFLLPRTPDRWRRSLGDGLTYLRGDRVAGTLVLALLAPNVFLGPAQSLGLPLRVSTAHWSAGWLGVAEAAGATGAILGSLAAIRWRAGATASSAFVLLVVQGAAITLIGVPSLGVVLAAQAVIGLTSGSASVWLSAAFQRAVAPAYLGRVSSVSQIGDLLLLPAATPLFGVLTTRTSLPATATGFGVGMMALSAWYATRPTLRAVVV